MDPSLSGFAVCLIDGDEVDLEEFASQPTGITIRERFSRYQRHCRMIMRWVMQQCNLKGMAVGIEGYSYGSEWKSESMAEFGCWIRRDLILAGAIPVEITPTQVRKFATGRGGGKGVTKQAVASALTKRYGVEFDSDNKSDAFAIAAIAACATGVWQPRTVAQVDIADQFQTKLRAERG